MSATFNKLTKSMKLPGHVWRTVDEIYLEESEDGGGEDDHDEDD